MKKLLDTVPGRVDAAFARFGTSAERAANLLRWYFCVGFALTGAWLLVNGEAGGWASLAVAAMWLGAVLVATSLTKRAAANAAPVGTLTTWLDVAVVSLGLLLMLGGRMLGAANFMLFLCYFPILALSARHYRAGLPVQVAAFISLLYPTLLLSTGASFSPSLFMVLAAVWVTVWGMALAATLLTRRPKNELADAAREVAREAYALGAKDKELELTELIHSQLLPVAQLEVPGLYCSSKHHAGLETSGDYYQVFETARGPLVVVGDLPGKGLTATMNFARLHQQVAQVVERQDSLADIAEALNDFVRQQYPGQVFTCVLARWEGANLHYLNAGHLPAVRISKRAASLLGVNSPALGAQADARFAEEVIDFPKGDLLVLYTDGSYTGLAASREQGAAEMLRLVNEFSGGEINTLCHRLFDCGQPEYMRSADDSTVVVVRRQELVGDEKELEKAAQGESPAVAV
jgi:hypothetical protein